MHACMIHDHIVIDARYVSIDRHFYRAAVPRLVSFATAFSQLTRPENPAFCYKRKKVCPFFK